MRPDIEAITKRLNLVYGMRNLAWAPPMLALVQGDVPALLAYIRELEDETRWRDAKTEPPPTELPGAPGWSNWVLAATVNAINRYVAVACRHEDGTWTDVDDCTVPVSHWCPLPKPPEVKE